MAKSIRSFPEGQRKAVIARRLAGKTAGLGYLAAKDAVEKGKVKAEAVAKAQEEPAEQEAEV